MEINGVGTEKFKQETAKMKKAMTPFEKRLYGIISNLAAYKEDLDILLTMTYLSGQQEGITFSENMIKEVCDENNISVD